MMKIFKKEYILLLILAVLCLVLYFLFLGHYKLIDVDEPRYAEAAREMLKSGNWLTPYFNYELRFDKPVFIYWLIAISYVIFGVTEFAARFPSAIMATLLVFFTYFFGRQTVSKSFGFISALILASSLEFLALARVSITDMTLTFFICATIFSGFLAAFSIDKLEKQKPEGFFEKHADVIYWNMAYLFSGAAVLTKGPVGFALPALVFAVCFILTGSLKKNLRLKYIIPGALVFFAVITPWYYLIIKEHGMKFVNYFFLEHNLARFKGGELGHEQPFYFYPLVIFLGTFPWLFYMISAFIKYLPETFTKFKDFKFTNMAVFKDADNSLKVILFSIVWFFLILIFFSASSAKMVT
ncbi:MAG: glycosyltransferase family 39 protein, partial [Candidatus Gastranaerophilales bacterium]|nr:glycosyltransferase family 39 protein [Candidatus Gastranaerophilales bacterium]